MKALLILAFFIPSAAQADIIDDQEDFCEPPKYTMKSMPSNGNGSSEQLKLLSDKERADPELAKAVFATPGGYGHSELGIRYLSRIFGYSADFNAGTKDKVELWLADQEGNKDPAFAGMHKLWEKWVMDPEHRLEVPRGNFSALPADGDPKAFFSHPFAKMKYVACVRNDVAKLMCENSMNNGRKLEEGDAVYFAKSGGRAFCHVPVPAWKKQREQNEELRRYGGGNAAPADSAK